MAMALIKKIINWLDVTFNSAEYRHWRDNRD